MITVKTAEEIEILRGAGKRLAVILRKLSKTLAPGVSGDELEAEARRLIKEEGDAPAFLGYRSRPKEKPYPSALCLSINNGVVHGIPFGKIIKSGDIVSLDLGLKRRGLFVDAAVSVIVPPANPNDNIALSLVSATKKALEIGIKEVADGKTTGDIGAAIEEFVKPFGFGIVRTLAGHGVGYAVHEEPLIPNFGKRGSGEKLKTGMIIAIEPMLNEGTPEVILGEDGFTFETKDGKRSAHFEHTALVGEKKAEILTIV